MFAKATALLALAASAAAHMTIEYPVPYGKATLNSSPLAPGDYPCKQRAGVYDVTEMNQWNAGETKTVSFIGSAVHGGGSCQFSLTTDTEPTEASQWKVIHSVVGGCPSNATGNLPEDPNGHGAATFPVTMPDNIADGRYTFAWTWINKVGNREFYMNCAPVQVGSSNTASAANAASALASLPDMFVANLPATSCSTAEGEDFNYPNPGQSLIEGNGADLGDTLTGSGCAAQVAMGAGSGQIGTPSKGTAVPSQAQSSKAPVVSAVPSNPGGIFAPGASSAPVAQPSTTAAVPSPVSSAVPSNPGGIFAPGASSAPAKEPSTTVAVAPTQPTATQQPTYDTPEGGNDTTPADESNCTPCTEDGAIVCVGSSQFGLCNRGCVVAQDLAAGMTCTNGAIVGSQSKRHLNFPRAHLHRRHGSRFF